MACVPEREFYAVRADRDRLAIQVDLLTKRAAEFEEARRLADRVAELATICPRCLGGDTAWKHLAERLHGERDYFAAHAIAALRVLMARTNALGAAQTHCRLVGDDYRKAVAELATVRAALRRLVEAHGGPRPGESWPDYYDRERAALRAALAALGAGERGGSGGR